MNSDAERTLLVPESHSLSTCQPPTPPQGEGVQARSLQWPWVQVPGQGAPGRLRLVRDANSKPAGGFRTWSGVNRFSQVCRARLLSATSGQAVVEGGGDGRVGPSPHLARSVPPGQGQPLSPSLDEGTCSAGLSHSPLGHSSPGISCLCTSWRGIYLQRLFQTIFSRMCE